MHFKLENHQPLRVGSLDPLNALALLTNMRGEKKRSQGKIFYSLLEAGKERAPNIPTNGLWMGQRINISLQLLFFPSGGRKEFKNS